MSPPARNLTRSPLATARPWDLVAEGYEEELLPMFAPYAEAALDLAAVAPEGRVLDVACGPGTLALLAAGRGLEVDALDISPVMIARLDAAAARRGLEVHATVGDAQDLRYPDGTFAAAFSLFGLMYFPDRARGYRELHRVIGPGGRLLVASWPPLDEAPALARVMKALGEAEPAFANPARGALTTAAEHEAEMTATGFTAVEVQRVAPTTTFPNINAFWDHMLRTSASLTLARLGAGEDHWQQVVARVHATLTAQHGDEPVEVTLPALLAVATRP